MAVFKFSIEVFLGRGNISRQAMSWIHNSHTSASSLPPTKEEVYVFARVRLSVCLSVSKITQKGVHGFG